MTWIHVIIDVGAAPVEASLTLENQDTGVRVRRMIERPQSSKDIPA